MKGKYAIILNIGLAVLAALWVSSYYRLAAVSGSSMEPTFTQGDIVLVKMGEPPQRGDIVVIDSKVIGRRIIKRVIAVEGDSVQAYDGAIWINGVILEEKYIKESYAAEALFLTVPEKCVYVMGDNRNHSRDSRMIGAISMDEVIGVVKH
ncbi:signal peptidase I [Enterocloster bolteae]|uniref:signal peptidase I n=1 Tax=Enterocloster bolteae TaxID=208479 RepID=UPI0028DD07E2|nr:signal peptidase I [Enterocloster bolteae]